MMFRPNQSVSPFARAVDPLRTPAQAHVAAPAAHAAHTLGAQLAGRGRAAHLLGVWWAVGCLSRA